MSPTNHSKAQQGVSLIIVIVLIMLSMLVALWASRSALFNELIVGNDADYQRAFEAAQAMIQDAEMDIQGTKADGSACIPVSGQPRVCRVPDGVNTVWFVDEDREVGDLIAVLKAQPTGCLNGICAKRTGPQDFWNDPTTLQAMMASNVGARYGQYTGASVGSTSSQSSNAILNRTAAGTGAWYWVEVMPYDPNAGNSGLITNGSKMLALNLKPYVVYLITAIARGLKPSTQAVIQTTYARQKTKN